jgi:methionyl-tRNA formyltransferase
VRLLSDQDSREIGTITLLRAEPVPSSRPSLPGRLLDNDGVVGAGEGGVRVLEVQPPSRRPMSLADYRRGNHWDAGLRIESIS